MKNNINIKEKIQYILSIILFLCTIVFFPSIASLLFAITAIIILPSIWEKLTTHINGKLLFVICIILFFVSCSLSPIKSKDTPVSTEQNNIISNNILFDNTINNTLTNTNSILANEIQNNITNTSTSNTTESTTKSSSQSQTNTDSVSSPSTSSTGSSKGSNSSSNSKSSSSASSKTDTTPKQKSNSSTSSSSLNKNSDTVWVGETGNKYHRQSCPTLKGKGHAISLSEAKAQGREPCKVCYK